MNSASAILILGPDPDPDPDPECAGGLGTALHDYETVPPCGISSRKKIDDMTEETPFVLLLRPLKVRRMSGVVWEVPKDAETRLDRY
jgi:hypothetical protein